MDEIRQNLNQLVDTLEQIDKRSRERSKVSFANDEINGHKVHGGVISDFSSEGIKDNATKTILTVADDGILVTTIRAKNLVGPVSVHGDLKVKGQLSASKLVVDDIISEIKYETSKPIEFGAVDDNPAYGKGLLWRGGDYTKQLILKERPDRFFASESIELRNGKIYMINGKNVLSEDTLGANVTKSNIKKLGTLDNLEVSGAVNIDGYVFYSGNNRLGLGTDSPNGAISIASFDHEFIIDSTDQRSFKVGSYTTSSLDLVTDDTTRLTIDSNGKISILKSLTISEKLSIGIKNPSTDADLTVAGPIRFMDKKFEVDSDYPRTGNYVIGDIVWNNSPKPTGFVGWVCTRSGTPGDWKPFGQISS